VNGLHLALLLWHLPSQRNHHPDPHLVENTPRSTPLAGGLLPTPWAAGGNRRNVALLRAHVAARHTPGDADDEAATAAQPEITSHIDPAAGAGGKKGEVVVDVTAGGGGGGERRAAAGAALVDGGWQLWLAARWVLAVATWPVRRLPVWVLILGVVLTPLAAGAGVFVFAAWNGLRWLGLV
jgi:hypothetical protein